MDFQIEIVLSDKNVILVKKVSIRIFTVVDRCVGSVLVLFVE